MGLWTYCNSWAQVIEMWWRTPCCNYSTFLCLINVNTYLVSPFIRAFFSCNVLLIELVSQTFLMASSEHCPSINSLCLTLIGFESYSNHGDTLEFFWRMGRYFYLSLITSLNYLIVLFFYCFVIAFGQTFQLSLLWLSFRYMQKSLPSFIYFYYSDVFWEKCLGLRFN